MLEVFVLILASILNVLIGLVVFLKNPSSVTNRYFLMMASSFVAWSVISYASLHPVWFAQITWVRLVLFSAVSLCLSVFLTLQAFPSFRFSQGILARRGFVAVAVVTMLLCLTDFVFIRLEGSGENAQPVPGPGMFAFAGVVAALLIGAAMTIYKKFKKSKGIERLQLRFVLMGLGVTLGLIFATNFLSVVVLQNSRFVQFGPAITLIFSASFAYAIVRHRLFDIKAAVARGVTYVLALSTIGLIYSVMLIGVTSLWGMDDAAPSSQRTLFIALAVLSSLLFPEIKKFFDGATSRFFYRDAYDPAQFLQSFNQLLMQKFDLDEIIEGSLKSIVETLHAQGGGCVVWGSRSMPRRFIGVHGVRLGMKKEVDATRELMSQIGSRVIIAGYQEYDHKLELFMHKHDIGMIAGVAKTDGRQKGAQQAVLIFGNKKSGDPYTLSDGRLVRIACGALSIAIDKAVQYETIQQFNLTLQAKVDDATRKLRATNDKLKKLDETKDEFISMASHQLRTPLTSIKGYLSMVLEGDAGKLNKQQSFMLNQSYMSSQRMVNLIADLLNLSRLNTGKFVIQNAPTDLRIIVDQEVSLLREAAAAKNIALNFEMPKTFTILPLDENKIHQVVMNFVDNAIYYTPAGGTIDVSLTETAKTVEFKVKDSGIGVPREVQRHLFTKFFRAENAKQARPDGTGLGIFMAKKVIAAQGGSILFESVEGKGSTFGFCFDKKLLESADVAKDAST